VLFAPFLPSTNVGRVLSLFLVIDRGVCSSSYVKRGIASVQNSSSRDMLYLPKDMFLPPLKGCNWGCNTWKGAPFFFTKKLCNYLQRCAT